MSGGFDGTSISGWASTRRTTSWNGAQSHGRRILPRTELRVGDRIPQVFRGHKGRSRWTGSLNRLIRRIAEIAQDAVDLDDVVGRLEVQAGEEIARRRVVEADRPVDGLFGIEDLLFDIGNNPAIPVSTGTLPPPLSESPPRAAPHPKPAWNSLSAPEPGRGRSACARDVDGDGVLRIELTEIPSLPGHVGDRRELAEVRRAERLAPAAADREIVDRMPS